MENQRTAPTREQIQVRAYEIYLQRGAEGDPVEDWLLAEQELARELADESAPEIKAAAATASASHLSRETDHQYSRFVSK